MKRKKVIRKIKALGRPLRRVAEGLGQVAIELHETLASVSDAAQAVTILCGKLGDLVDRELGARPAGDPAAATQKPAGCP